MLFQNAREMFMYNRVNQTREKYNKSHIIKTLRRTLNFHIKYYYSRIGGFAWFSIVWLRVYLSRPFFVAPITNHGYDDDDNDNDDDTQLYLYFSFFLVGKSPFLHIRKKKFTDYSIVRRYDFAENAHQQRDSIFM